MFITLTTGRNEEGHYWNQPRRMKWSCVSLGSTYKMYKRCEFLLGHCAASTTISKTASQGFPERFPFHYYPRSWLHSSCVQLSNTIRQLTAKRHVITSPIPQPIPIEQVSIGCRQAGDSISMCQKDRRWYDSPAMPSRMRGNLFNSALVLLWPLKCQKSVNTAYVRTYFKTLPNSIASGSWVASAVFTLLYGRHKNFERVYSPE